MKLHGLDNWWFHIPLWKSNWGNDGPAERVYLRFEILFTTNWASGGRNQDKSLRIYRRGIEVAYNWTLCLGRVNTPITWNEY